MLRAASAIDNFKALGPLGLFVCRLQDSGRDAQYDSLGRTPGKRHTKCNPNVLQGIGP